MNKKEIEAAFRVFGMTFESSLAEVKAEYKNLACAFHPDRYEAGSNKQNWAAEKLIELTSAYESLQKYFEEYPEGPPPSWSEPEAEFTPGDQERGSSSEDDEGYCEWNDWKSQSKKSAHNDRQDWQAQQDSRQQELKANDQVMNRNKLAFYGKIAAVVFVCVMWAGRVGNAEAIKIMAANEHQALVEQQAYEQARQGTNIDGFVWDANVLDERHRNQIDQLTQKNREVSAKTWTSGWFTSILSLVVLWFLIAPPIQKLLSKKEDTK